ncbi:MAG: bifunctional DNA primase/polymerase [Sphingomonadaceae bacterium]
MGGLFAEWQPRYADAGIPTFPVRDKRPAVKGYLKTGLKASGQFALKFSDEDAFGFACRRNRITVLDVDTPDERILCDALSEFGPTPLVVRSGSGNWQAWYRNGGEKRKVRPDPARPIDILGDGFVVAPPSRGSKGRYELISGSLEDLAKLPLMRRREVERAAEATPANDTEHVQEGLRNQTLWRRCMAHARNCETVEGLIAFAADTNRTAFAEPLPDGEVLAVATKVWAKQLKGENWFGAGQRVVFDHTEIDGLLRTDPDAFILLTLLRRHHWGREFHVANAMAESMPGGGWSRKRFADTRSRLERHGEIEMIRPPSSYHGPAVYKFKGGRK